MEVQALLLREHLGLYVFNLAHDVGIGFAPKVLFVQGIEGLGHVDAVQPHLVGVDGLVPEIPLMGAGLPAQLCPEEIRRPAVFFIPGALIQGKKHPALVDVVQVIGFRLEGADGTVLAHKVIHAFLDELEIARVAREMLHLRQGGEHTAVYVVPGGGLALPDLLHIPDGAIRGGLLHQPEYIFVDFFIVHQFSSKSSVTMSS